MECVAANCEGKIVSSSEGCQHTFTAGSLTHTQKGKETCELDTDTQTHTHARTLTLVRLRDALKLTVRCTKEAKTSLYVTVKFSGGGGGVGGAVVGPVKMCASVVSPGGMAAAPPTPPGMPHHAQTHAHTRLITRSGLCILLKGALGLVFA